MKLKQQFVSLLTNKVFWLFFTILLSALIIYHLGRISEFLIHLLAE